MTLDEIKQKIDEANSILILTHENPDGDAIGSSLAMYLVLTSLGKEVEVIVKGMPDNFKFLPHSDSIKETPSREIYDIVLVLDSSDIKRIENYEEYFENAKTRIVIDHHSSNAMFGDYNFVNPASPACAQILVAILEYWKIEISKEVATCLMTGIITDTGGYKNSGTTAETFEFSAWAIQKGVNIQKVFKNAMQVISRNKFELKKLAINRLELLEDGKIAFTYLTKEDDERFSYKPGDHDGIVEIGRDIEGVEVSIFLYEKENGVFKASLRSNDYVNVSDVCLLLGGGGHIKAAGCNIYLPLEQAKEKIINETKRYLK